MTVERATSFGSVAEDYDRFRPGPPARSMDWLIPPGCAVAMDLAAGTGLFTRALAERVPEVIAVEPDARMRAVLAERSPRVRALEGTAEAIPLAEASLDAAFVSAAWHWFDPPIALAELGRVLRDGGRLGVVWTSRDRSVDWVAELDPARLADGSSADSGDRRLRRDLKSGFDASVAEHGGFGPVSSAEFTFTRTMPLDAAAAWTGTYSQVITATPEDRSARLDRARAILAQHADDSGTVEIPMVSLCWRTDRLPR
ncbi:MAG: class I SAM-dependent methyltransferase [Nocardia sp.]|nr:class I SAM-dependent methyltransferase [Nocardia sp.]